MSLTDKEGAKSMAYGYDYKKQEVKKLTGCGRVEAAAPT